MKILLIGDEEVGKTQIFNQFVNNKFDAKYTPTIGLEISHKNKELSIYDIAGQERFQSISTSYHQDTTAYILVYDVTNHTSFDNIKKHIEEVKSHNDNIPIILVGNKTDLIKDRTVNKEFAQKFAKQNGMTFFETSAKENCNIKELFKKAINIPSLEEKD
jgi:small GTP-binding protein